MDTSADGPSTAVACWAPRSALYLRPDGLVHACCATAFAVGSVTGPSRQALREIWSGAALDQQARALAVGSYDLGCQECDTAQAAGARSTSLAAEFDRYATDGPRPFPALIDFAMSNRCNLRCVMCNGNLSSSIRAQREHLPPLPSAYDDRFFDELDEFLPHLQRAQFKGGEPFLARENRVVWDRLLERRLSPEVSVTTNGTIWDDHVEHYASALQMHVNVSVDAVDDAALEAIRVGVSARELWRNVDRFQSLAEAGGRGMTLTFCLMSTNWRELAPFLHLAERRGLSPNVVTVHHPTRFDLLRLPPGELLEVHRAMQALAPTFESSETDRIWHSVVRSLQVGDAAPVEVTVRRPAGQPDVAAPSLTSDAVRALKTTLDEQHGVPAVEIELDDGVISRVVAPPWADWLGTRGWTGLSLEAVAVAIEDATGGSLVTGALPAQHPDTERLILAIDTELGRRTLEAVRFKEAGGGRSGVLLHPDSTRT